MGKVITFRRRSHITCLTPWLQAKSDESGDQEIPISSFTVLVLVDSIASNYAGGLARFDRQHPWARRNSNLCALIFMSGGELNEYLGEMRRFDLALGRDLAVGEAMYGEWEACPAIRFENRRDGFPPAWVAIYDTSYDPGPQRA